MPTNESKFYRCEEVARILRISKQTLIRYESKGLFPKARRNPLNKWREYTPEEVQKLQRIIGRELPVTY